LVIGDFRIVRQRLKLNPNHDEEMPKSGVDIVRASLLWFAEPRLET